MPGVEPFSQFDDALGGDFSRDGRVFAWGQRFHRLRAFDFNTRQITDHITTTSAIFDVSVDATGQRFAFSSASPTLMPNGTGNEDVYVFDTSGSTELISVGLTNSGLAASRGPQITADGRFVVFWSLASNLVTNDTNATADIFVADRTQDSLQRVNTDANGAQANGASLGAPRISDDGRWVAFISEASNLVAGDNDGVANVFIKDTMTGAVTRWPGARPDLFAAFDMSADGRWLTAHGSGLQPLVFDRTTGQQVPVGQSCAECPITISADGSLIATGEAAGLQAHANPLFVPGAQSIACRPALGTTPDQWRFKASNLSDVPSPAQQTFTRLGNTVIQYVGWAGNYTGPAARRWDSTSNTWQPFSGPTLPYAGTDHRAHAVNDTLALYGPSGHAVFNPTLLTHTPTPGGPAWFDGMRGATIGNQVVYFGSSLQVFDAATNSMAAGTLVGAPSLRRDAIVVSTGTQVLVWGGFVLAGGQGATDGALYDPATDQWSALPAGGPHAVQGQGVFTGTELIVFNGTVAARHVLGTPGWQSIQSPQNSVGPHVEMIWTGQVAVAVGELGWAAYSPLTDDWYEGDYAPYAVVYRSGDSVIWTGNDILIQGAFGARLGPIP